MILNEGVTAESPAPSAGCCPIWCESPGKEWDTENGFMAKVLVGFAASDPALASRQGGTCKGAR